MKKLKNLNLKTTNLLQRSQLKTVFGGEGGYTGSCLDECTDDSDCDQGYDCMCLSVPSCAEENNPLTRCVWQH